ncbi:TnsA-like heteromeric transposase endonuclease subunit [Microbacterium aurum]
MPASPPQYTLRLDGSDLERGELANLEARHVFEAEPRRTFRWHRGQRHYPGRYWCATTKDFVGYESCLELAALLLEDFDHRAVRIASQPFELIADRDGVERSYVPDYMIEHDDHRFTVIEVKPKCRRRTLRSRALSGGQATPSNPAGGRTGSSPNPPPHCSRTSGFSRATDAPGSSPSETSTWSRRPLARQPYLARPCGVRESPWMTSLTRERSCSTSFGAARFSAISPLPLPTTPNWRCHEPLLRYPSRQHRLVRRLSLHRHRDRRRGRRAR